MDEIYHNVTPLFTEWVIGRAYLHEPFIVIDVGVQGGPHVRWQYLGSCARAYGFDPISEVIESLEKTKEPTQLYRAIALGNEDGQRQFRVPANIYESSFYSSSMDTGSQGTIALCRAQWAAFSASSSSARKSEIAFGHRAESPAERHHFRFKPGWIRSQSANLVFPAAPPFNQRPCSSLRGLKPRPGPYSRHGTLKRAKWRMSDVPVEGHYDDRASAGRFSGANTEGKA
jgi:hypothetical protein